MMKKTICLFLIAIVFGFAALAETYQHGNLTIYEGRVRPTIATSSATAAYLTIHNHGTSDDRLIAVNTQVAGLAQIHNMTIENGIMKMRPLNQGITIPAGESVILKPHGLHLMLMRLTKPLKEGEHIEVILTFENHGAITLNLPVMKIHSAH